MQTDKLERDRSHDESSLNVFIFWVGIAIMFVYKCLLNTEGFLQHVPYCILKRHLSF